MNQTIVVNVMHNEVQKSEFFSPKSIQNLQKSAQGTWNGPLISYLGWHEQLVRWTIYVMHNMAWTIGWNSTVSNLFIVFLLYVC